MFSCPFLEHWIPIYPYISGLVGKVENGFVLYADNGLVSEKVLDHGALHIAGIYRHDSLPISKTYDILNETKLKEGLAAGGIAVKSSGGNFTCDIKNAQYDLVDKTTSGDAGNPEYSKAVKKDDRVYWYPYIYQYFSFDGIPSDLSEEGSSTVRAYILRCVNIPPREIVRTAAS